MSTKDVMTAACFYLYLPMSTIQETAQALQLTCIAEGRGNIESTEVLHSRDSRTPAST